MSSLWLPLSPGNRIGSSVCPDPDRRRGELALGLLPPPFWSIATTPRGSRWMKPNGRLRGFAPSCKRPLQPARLSDTALSSRGLSPLNRLTACPKLLGRLEVPHPNYAVGGNNEPAYSRSGDPNYIPHLECFSRRAGILDGLLERDLTVLTREREVGPAIPLQLRRPGMSGCRLTCQRPATKALSTRRPWSKPAATRPPAQRTGAGPRGTGSPSSDRWPPAGSAYAPRATQKRAPEPRQSNPERDWS